MKVVWPVNGKNDTMCGIAYPAIKRKLMSEVNSSGAKSAALNGAFKQPAGDG